MEMGDFVRSFAAGMKSADSAGPRAANARTGQLYQPGIGPHSESETITLALANGTENLLKTARREVPYPSVPRSACDVVVDGDDGLWAIEVKMLRMMGDNGKLNDNMLMHILSPYPKHRSALTDCTKLTQSGFSGRKGVVIFGYDYPDFPMRPAIDAFELLASQHVRLGHASVCAIDGLVHPVHQVGAVYGWEIEQQ